MLELEALVSEMDKPGRVSMSKLRPSKEEEEDDTPKEKILEQK